MTTGLGQSADATACAPVRLSSDVEGNHFTSAGNFSAQSAFQNKDVYNWVT